MLEFLYKFQNILNRIAEHPISLLFCTTFLIGWTTCSLLSHGAFDNGLGIENLLINGLSVLLLFAANSKRTEHAENLYLKHEETQAQLDAIKSHLEEKLK